MLKNNKLRLHFINVNHGDATIIEFPDYGIPKTAHFGVVDFGAKLAEDRWLTTYYMKSLVALRKDNDQNFKYVIDFICVTHPHDDHYGGLSRFMKHFALKSDNKVRSYWDCGFRTNAANYNKVLKKITDNENLTFIRLSAGTEFEFGEVRITVLAPSVDLRNRFDTYGVEKNDASVVLKVKYKNSYAILAADAEFASWGKSTEEFPRTKSIKFFKDALGLAERGETSDQLRCNLLRISHHGSMHGSSLEYLERLKPKHIVIPAGKQKWYEDNVSKWKGYFPHPLIRNTWKLLKPEPEIHITGVKGNMIFKYKGGRNPWKITKFTKRPDGKANYAVFLKNKWEE